MSRIDNSIDLVNRDFYAIPPYIGSHQFVGRRTQLETLTEWASPADSHSVLLFEAIGGSGKSMLTWEWAKNRSMDARPDWRGRFWYSFYERGATMDDFCRKALAYITGRSWTVFREKSVFELGRQLIEQLRSSPWLLILDGLERVLVSYHRFDAPRLRDEDAGISDQISRRHPCASINPEDDELLRNLAGASPSKLLLTTRLVPRALLNHSNQPIPGVLREHLPGLRPHDAEIMIRSCGVFGNSREIQNYLKTHCDCHPLVVGVLAGLINDYLSDRGNFDLWVSDKNGGGQLNFSDLDLIQKRNHIMAVALSALPESSHQLLSTMALLSGSFDYETISAIDPTLSPMPEDPSLVVGLGDRLLSQNPQQRKRLALEFKSGLNEAINRRNQEMAAASQKLNATIRDLENRGLLQYDTQTRRHDLHPVVRGIAAGGLQDHEKDRYGQRLIDYFSTKSSDPYENAIDINDFDNARVVLSALLQLNRMAEAKKFILNNTFMQIMNFRFEAHNDIVAMLRPFFPEGWHSIGREMEEKGGVSIAKRASHSLRRIGAFEESFSVASSALNVILRRQSDDALVPHLLGVASCAGELNSLELEDRILGYASDISCITKRKSDFLPVAIATYRNSSLRGNFELAEKIWQSIELEKKEEVPRAIVAHHRALQLYLSEHLTESDLLEAFKINREARSALGARNLTALKGLWHLDRLEDELAKTALMEAVYLARKVGKADRRSELRLATAQLRLNESIDLQGIPTRLEDCVDRSCFLDLAVLWTVLENNDLALVFSKAAYMWSFADGGKHVRAHDLKRSAKLLLQLGENPPDFSVIGDSSRTPTWEEGIASALKRIKLRAER